MGSQMRRCAALKDLGVTDEDVQMEIVFAEEALEAAGDGWSDVLYEWDEAVHAIIKARTELPLGDPLPDPLEAFLEAGTKLIADQLEALAKLKGLYTKHVKP